MNVSTNRKIAKASAILIIASSCGCLLALAKEMLVANYFGITRAMDAFYAAVAFPTLINNVLLTTFGAVFIPLFIRYRLKDRMEANRIASITLNYLVLFLVLTALLLALCAPWIIQYGFHGLARDTATMAVHMLRILCITVVLSGIIGIMTGILNAQEHFTAPAFSNMMITASTILCIVLFVNRWGVLVLPYGLLAGLVAQFLFLVPVLRAKGFNHSLSLTAGHPAVNEMLSLSCVYFWAIIAAQVNLLVDRVMASYLAPGSIAALGYAEKLIQVPIIIFTGSLATAVYPFFSSQVAENKIDELKDSLAKSIRISGLIFIPLTAMLMVLAEPLIQLIFQRGAFGHDATELTSALLICYSLQLFFYTAGIIIIRVFLAFQEMAILVKVASAGVILNVLLNVLFIKLVRPPAAGIALSTSCVQMIMTAAFFVALRKKIGAMSGRSVAIGVAKVVAVTVVMGLGMQVIYGLCRRMMVQPTDMSCAVCVLITVVSGCLIFGVLGFLMKVEELNYVTKMVKKRVGGVIHG